jgi:hypothetical protein
MSDTKINILDTSLSHRSLNFLNSGQVQMIDEALTALGEYGELRLIVEKGRLRFLVTQRSFDALKWQPGALGDQVKRIQG